MDCQEAQSWMVSHIIGDMEPKSYQKLALEEHLRTCRTCSEEYKENKETIEFIEINKAEFAAAIESSERTEALERQEIEQSWNLIEKRLAKNEKERKNINVFKLLWKSALAAAACIAFAISISFVIINQNDSNSAPTQISYDLPSIKIEKLVDGIAQTIQANREISTESGQLATLIINSKHKMILNENTSVSISSLVSANKIGCTVNLSYGRIYTHVEHDGNPFVVETANGKAIITGTTFDIEANKSKMKLIVSEGSVTFASQAGSVDVTAGHFSEIFSKSSPLQPSLCDPRQLTAWATGYELEKTIATIGAISDTYEISDLWLTANSGPVDLEKINYELWIEKKRDWFKNEFPSIFKLQDILTLEGTMTEYQELLFASGTAWEFKYSQVSNRRFSFITSDSLLRIVSGYNLDRDWLLKNMPSIKSLDKNITEQRGIFTGQEAFKELIQQFEKAQKSKESLNSDILLYSLHASTYLANTRTLLWLYITNEETNLTSEHKADLLALLQNEVNEAQKIKEYILRLFTISEKCPCEEFNKLVEKVIDSLNVITEIEKAMGEFQNGR